MNIPSYEHCCRRILAGSVLSVLLLALSGCGEPEKRNVGVYMLLDTSGTYTDEIGKAQQIINFTLSQLNPGDSLCGGTNRHGQLQREGYRCPGDLR